MIFSHITLHILLINISKAHCDRMKTTPLPTRLFRSQIQPSWALNKAEFPVPYRTHKSTYALDFHMTHYPTPPQCVLQKSRRYLKYCALQRQRGQGALWSDAENICPECSPSWHRARPPPWHAKHRALLTHVKRFQSPWFFHIALYTFFP